MKFRNLLAIAAMGLMATCMGPVFAQQHSTTFAFSCYGQGAPEEQVRIAKTQGRDAVNHKFLDDLAAGTCWLHQPMTRFIARKGTQDVFEFDGKMREFRVLEIDDNIWTVVSDEVPST